MIRASSKLDPLFDPRSIAIIGASQDEARIGGRPIAYMRRAGFRGAIYPVNPSRSEIQGLRAHASIEDIADPVDLAILALPGAKVIEAAESCARCGVKSLVVFSAGFAEIGEGGRAAQAELAQIGIRSGMRILGPNTLGIFNAHSRAFATFGVAVEENMPAAGGRIGIASQSGGYAGYVLALAKQRGLEIGSLITTGNECDVDIGEAVLWLAEQSQVDTILLYLEGVRNGGSLLAGLEAARKHSKPVVAIKVGATETGAAAAASHTAALSGADHVYNAIFREFGVYRAHHTEEMFDAAYALSRGKRPIRDGVALVTVSGGIGVHMSDLAHEAGLNLPPLAPHAKARLREIVPFSSAANPLDVTGQVTNDVSVLRSSLDVMLDDGDYGSAVVFLGHAGGAASMRDQLVQSIRDTTARFDDRLILVCTTGDAAAFEDAGALCLPDPKRAIQALSAAHFFARERGFERPGAGETSCLDRNRVFNEAEAKAALAAIGVFPPTEVFTSTPQEAAAAARKFGERIALKIVSRDLPHKTDAGGVALNVPVEEVEARGQRMMLDVARAAPHARVEGLLVSEMITGVEMIAGVHRDPVFGPIVVVGLGGIAVELLRDVSRRRAPISESQALEMLRDLRGYPLLDGYRGREKADVSALAVAVSAISRLAAANADRLETLEINPLVVLPAGHGVRALDCVLRTS
jgi:acetate---CoA ligase (ADP-forming)